MNVHWLWLSAAVASFGLTWVAMRFAGRLRMLDFPNERSSHARPVPRGGGIAIVLTFTAGMIVGEFYGVVDSRLLAVVVGGGGLVGLVGIADDYRDVPAGWRFVVHILVAGWAVYWLGGIPGELLPGAPPMLLNFLGVVSVVWLINLFNFMDGIDGIAGIETITVCLGILIVYAFSNAADSAWIPPAILMACVAGFLFWNFPPARIFLGDSGSGFLGLMMAVFCIQAAHLDPGLFWAWMILQGVFIVDSGVTLFRRLGRRQRLHKAHRSHAYQFAAKKYAGHAPVSLAVGAINLIWLLPLALLAASGRVPAVPALLSAYAPLFWLAFHFKAGAAESDAKSLQPASSLWISWNTHRRTTGLCAAWDVPLHVIRSQRNGLWRWIEQALMTLSLLRRQKTEILFVQNPSLALTVLVTLTRPLFGYSLIVDAHNEGVRPFHRPGALVCWLTRYLLRVADATIVTNPALAKDVTRAGGRPLVLPDRLPEPPALPLQHDATEPAPHVVVVATFWGDEPIAAIMEAAATMPEIRFAFTGDTGRFLRMGIELPDNVRLSGYLQDAAYWRLLAQAGVICDLTLKPDCLVCGAYEALAMGKPMVLSDNPATREIFGPAAVLTGSMPDEIARAVSTAIEQREQLGANALELRKSFQITWQTQGATAWSAILAASQGSDTATI